MNTKRFKTAFCYSHDSPISTMLLNCFNENLMLFQHLRPKWRPSRRTSRRWTAGTSLSRAPHWALHFPMSPGSSTVRKSANSCKFMQILISLWIPTDTTVIESSSRFQIFNNGDLVISNIQEKDAGAYKCVRSNEAGSVSGEAFLGVLGNEGGNLWKWKGLLIINFQILVRTHITQPPADSTVLLGLTATLQCKVSSDQNVDYSIQWFRDRQ